ncbi:MAG: hypothetical protein ACXAC8_15195 [Candidatus Hodarchaeales archaeon]|jgi:hypothetical protein
MSTEQNDKITRIKGHKAKIESESTLIQQRIIDFQKESKKALKNYSTSLNQSKSSVLSEVNSLMTNINNLTKELNDYKKKTLVSEKDELNDRLNDLLGQISSGVQKLQQTLATLSTKQEEDVSAIYSQMASKVNKGLNNIYSDQRSQITDFENDISSRLEKIQRDIVSAVESESANHREMTDGIASTFLDSLNKFKSKIINLSESKETSVDTIFTGTASDSVSRFEVAKEDLLASIDGVMNNLEDSLSTQKDTNEEMKKTIQEIITSSKSDVKEKIENFKTISFVDWQKKQDEQVTALTAIRSETDENFKNSLNKNETFQADLLENLENQLKTNLYNEIDNITLSFTKFQDSTFNQIDSLISRLTNTRDEMKSTLDGLLVANLNKIGGIGKQLEEQISSVLTEVSGEYKKIRESTLSGLMSVVDERFNIINSSLDQYGTTTRANIENTITNVDVSLLNFFNDTLKNATDTVTKNTNTLDQLASTTTESFRNLQSGQEKNIETTLADVKNIFRTKQSELITAISSILPTAEDHIESTREFIDDKSSELSSKSSATFGDLREQIKLIEQDGLSAIQSIVNETQQKLDDNVSSSEERTKKLIEGLEDEHKGSIAKYRANASQEINQNIEMLDNYRENLKEKFTRFFDDQQRSLDLFIDANQTKREIVDDQRRNLDVKFEEVSTTIDSATEKLNMNINTNTSNVTSSVKKILQDVDDVITTIK